MSLKQATIEYLKECMDAAERGVRVWQEGSRVAKACKSEERLERMRNHFALEVKVIKHIYDVYMQAVSRDELQEVVRELVDEAYGNDAP